MSLSKSLKRYFQNWLDVSTRSSRSEFWWLFSFNFVFIIMLNLFQSYLFFSLNIFLSIFYSFTGIAFMSLCIRRMHDINRSGWWLWLNIIPIIGWVITLIWLCKCSDIDELDVILEDGKKGKVNSTNRFGKRSNSKDYLSVSERYSKETSNKISESAPKELKYFEWLFFGSLVLGILISIFTFSVSNSSTITLNDFLGYSSLGLFFAILLILNISRYRNRTVFWIFIIGIAINYISVFGELYLSYYPRLVSDPLNAFLEWSRILAEQDGEYIPKIQLKITEYEPTSPLLSYGTTQQYLAVLSLLIQIIGLTFLFKKRSMQFFFQS